MSTRMISSMRWGGYTHSASGAMRASQWSQDTGSLAFAYNHLRQDPNGIRPLIYGKRETPKGTDYMFASESVSLEALGFSDFIDVKPGQAVIVTRTALVSRQCVAPGLCAPCIFEYVYFARPDSIIDGISVYRARLAMGEALAIAVMGKLDPAEIDVVIPVPDTSRPAALQVAHKLGKLYREGFVKNRYVGRTFIMPGQQERVKSVRRKLNPMTMEFAGKNVLLVDGVLYLSRLDCARNNFT